MSLMDWRVNELMLTKVELAEKLGVTPALLCMVESGKAKFSTKLRGRIKAEFGSTIAKELEA